MKDLLMYLEEDVRMNYRLQMYHNGDNFILNVSKVSYSYAIINPVLKDAIEELHAVIEAERMLLHHKANQYPTYGSMDKSEIRVGQVVLVSSPIVNPMEGIILHIIPPDRGVTADELEAYYCFMSPKAKHYTAIKRSIKLPRLCLMDKFKQLHVLPIHDETKVSHRRW